MLDKLGDTQWQSRNMKHYLTTLFHIAPWYIQNIVSGGFEHIKKNKTPERVKGYRLVKDYSSKSTPFATGVYKDNRNHLVVIKTWEGSRKSLYYFNLLHQIDVARCVTRIQKRLSATKKYGFAIPNYIDSMEKNNRVSLIMEYTPGRAMEQIKSIDRQWEIYKRCLKFLQSLSQTSTHKERNIITVKTGYDFIFLYFFILPVAMLMQPKLIMSLLRGAIIFLSGVPHILKLKPDRIIHGDIHCDNILISGDTCYLIDIENMRFSYPAYEPISTVALKGNHENLKKLIISEFIDSQKNIDDLRKAYAALIINNVTHNLSGDSRKENVLSYMRLFKYGLKLGSL